MMIHYIPNRNTREKIEYPRICLCDVHFLYNFTLKQGDSLLTKKGDS